MTKGVGGSTGAAELALIRPRTQRGLPISTLEYATRLETARRFMAEMGADALIVGAGASLRYFTGTPWGPSERMVALVLRRSGRPVMICPAFELGSLQAVLTIEADIRLWQEDENPMALATTAVRDAGSKVAIDPALPFFMVDGLRRTDAGLELMNGAAVVNGCRQIKSAAELALISEAMAMTLDVQRHAAAILAPGILASEVTRFIDTAHRAIGADGGSSFCAVQFGQATSYPHGVPGDQVLQEGDVVLIDTGCLVQGYHADITRTYVFGKPTGEQRRIWEIEHEAQEAAYNAVRPGVACEAIDAAARTVLVRHGLGPGYRLPGLPHRTGHGIGLSIHEPAYLVRGDTTPLASGMCFSNEPMIVVPEHFGVRLEDHFHVTEYGAAWFTRPSPSIDVPFE
jgi:Xaa-Pro dipeptidase